MVVDADKTEAFEPGEGESLMMAESQMLHLLKDGNKHYPGNYRLFRLTFSF